LFNFSWGINTKPLIVSTCKPKKFHLWTGSHVPLSNARTQPICFINGTTISSRIGRANSLVFAHTQKSSTSIHVRAAMNSATTSQNLDKFFHQFYSD
jgi:hypothetical protein